MKEQICHKCQKKLSFDERAICCKYLAPGQARLCLDHLAEMLNVTREILEEKIEELKEDGCPLFN